MTISRQLVRRENGYEVWREEGSPRLMAMEVCYTAEGDHIGNEKTARFLCIKKGIKPLPRNNGRTCEIGFSEKDGKWYGWSHRAISGFQIGDVAKEGDCVCSSGWTDEYLANHPEEDLSLPVGFEAKTVEDAKHMAIAFAESVS